MRLLSKGKRSGELEPWKSVGVEEEHEIAARGARPQASGEAPLSISRRYDRADRALGIRARRRERGALGASSRERTRQHERRGQLAMPTAHNAASARSA